jgi:hypothetical protein
LALVVLRWVCLFFVFFMLFGSFFLVNLFVGIIVDNFAAKREEIGTRHVNSPPPAHTFVL